MVLKVVVDDEQKGTDCGGPATEQRCFLDPAQHADKYKMWPVQAWQHALPPTVKCRVRFWVELCRTPVTRFDFICGYLLCSSSEGHFEISTVTYRSVHDLHLKLGSLLAFL